MTKPIRYKVIATIFGILSIWLISGSSGAKGISVILLAAGFLVIVSGIVPFIIGIILQALFRKRKLGFRAALILTAIVVALLIYISGRPPITFLDNFVLGILFPLVVCYIFIDTGIKCCNAYRQGRAEHNNSIQRTANSRR